MPEVLGTGSKVQLGNLLIGAAQIAGGVMAQDSAYANASLMEGQGLLTREDYNKQALLVDDEGKRFRAKQTMDYISSGVEMVGTAQLVAKETLFMSQAKSRSLRSTGAAMQTLAQKKAEITRSEGRAALISGALTGAGTMLNTFS